MASALTRTTLAPAARPTFAARPATTKRSSSLCAAIRPPRGDLTQGGDSPLASLQVGPPARSFFFWGSREMTIVFDLWGALRGSEARKALRQRSKKKRLPFAVQEKQEPKKFSMASASRNASRRAHRALFCPLRDLVEAVRASSTSERPRLQVHNGDRAAEGAEPGKRRDAMKKKAFVFFRLPSASALLIFLLSSFQPRLSLSLLSSSSSRSRTTHKKYPKLSKKQRKQPPPPQQPTTAALRLLRLPLGGHGRARRHLLLRLARAGPADRSLDHGRVDDHRSGGERAAGRGREEAAGVGRGGGERWEALLF